MVGCPNCHSEMAPQAQEAYGAMPHPVEVGCCAACNLFWFDDSGSIRLTPKAVMGLFRYIGQAGAARNTLASNFRCPRCGGALALTHDLQRTTHFTYWRCPNDHGQLMTFHQFLAEKNFIRPPSADELARLRDTVRQINCSQCGAPIDLASDSACQHCGAPVALIDAEGVAKALHDLAASGAIPTPVTADSVRAALIDAQVNALFDLERMREREVNQDLLSIGAGAIGALVGGWLLSRS